MERRVEKRDGSMGGNDVMRRLMWNGVMGSILVVGVLEVDWNEGMVVEAEVEVDWDGRILAG